MDLLGEDDLENSGVVANCQMNREREITGTNSYTHDLGFDVLSFLSERLGAGREVAWLDLCCGSARALSQACKRLRVLHGDSVALRVDGVDLVDRFHPKARCESLNLHVRSIREFQPEAAYDLVTCVHGLHYVGDKLRALSLACSWLKPDGRFLASTDLQNLRLLGGAGTRVIAKALRTGGLTYDSRRRVLGAEGRLELKFPFRFEGADDQAGPNSTGQPAVNSYYSRTVS